MRRITQQSKIALAALGALSLGACGQLPKAPNKQTSEQKVEACLIDADMLALGAEKVSAIVTFQSGGGELDPEYSTRLTLPNGEVEYVDTGKSEGGLNGDTAVRKDLQKRVAAALNEACAPFSQGVIDRMTATKRINNLGVGAGVVKFDLGDAKPVQPTAKPAGTGTFLKRKVG